MYWNDKIMLDVPFFYEIRKNPHFYRTKKASNKTAVVFVCKSVVPYTKFIACLYVGSISLPLLNFRDLLDKLMKVKECEKSLSWLSRRILFPGLAPINEQSISSAKSLSSDAGQASIFVSIFQYFNFNIVSIFVSAKSLSSDAIFVSFNWIFLDSPTVGPIYQVLNLKIHFYRKSFQIKYKWGDIRCKRAQSYNDFFVWVKSLQEILSVRFVNLLQYLSCLSCLSAFGQT